MQEIPRQQNNIHHHLTENSVTVLTFSESNIDAVTRFPFHPLVLIDYECRTVCSGDGMLEGLSDLLLQNGYSLLPQAPQHPDLYLLRQPGEWRQSHRNSADVPEKGARTCTSAWRQTGGQLCGSEAAALFCRAATFTISWRLVSRRDEGGGFRCGLRFGSKLLRIFPFVSPILSDI